MSDKRPHGYVVEGVPRKEQKNLGAQIVMAVLVGLIFFGPLIARLFGWRAHLSIGEIGAIVAIDVLLLIAVTVWAVRTWEW
jgi:protein-S-isoprenylcysteine O-methyltransferase Ste14